LIQYLIKFAARSFSTFYFIGLLLSSPNFLHFWATGLASKFKESLWEMNLGFILNMTRTFQLKISLLHTKHLINSSSTINGTNRPNLVFCFNFPPMSTSFKSSTSLGCRSTGSLRGSKSKTLIDQLVLASIFSLLLFIGYLCNIFSPITCQPLIYQFGVDPRGILYKDVVSRLPPLTNSRLLFP